MNTSIFGYAFSTGHSVWFDIVSPLNANSLSANSTQ